MKEIIKALHNNKDVFSDLLSGLERDQYSWCQSSEKWCLLEIICHLYDEERLDFRFRTKWVLEQPNEVPPAFDQLRWVKEHDYISQNYSIMLQKFISERTASIEWLNHLNDPRWENSFEHPKLGTLTAGYFLKNWLAHDYLHMRQILKLKFDYLRDSTAEGLNYAGTW
jgi:hypothetical protein